MSAAGVDTRILYTGLVALVAVQRLVELAVARRNVRWLRSRGGREVGAAHYPWMVALHTTVLLACPAEVWLLDRPFLPALAAAMLVLLGAAAALRLWVMRTLGRRWTTRVVVLPGAPRVVGGPFRFLAHPNYLAVATELLALPLVHTAWLTAVGGSLANAALLSRRIAVEQAALDEATGKTCREGSWSDG